MILFGLSMDYHVFIISRIREAVDRGDVAPTSAVAHGIKATAGVVTSAAVVMVAVFAIFASLSMIEFKQMGVGLAVAILLDATLVRAVLLPAAMKLLGERNWYLPRRLHWLPKWEHEHGTGGRCTPNLARLCELACSPGAETAPASMRSSGPSSARASTPTDTSSSGFRYGWAGVLNNDDGAAHAREHARHPAPRRDDPRVVPHERVQGRRRPEQGQGRR